MYYARAYHSDDLENPVGIEDEIDPIGGHYGISGNDEDFPTGWYLIKTDIVTRNGLLYSGRRLVYHVYGEHTICDITLYPHPIFSQIEGTVSFENGSKPSGNPNIYTYLKGYLYGTTTIQTNGYYSFYEIPEYWPTGNYYIVTDLIYKKGFAYQGSRTVSHEEFQKSFSQDLVLVRYESRPSN